MLLFYNNLPALSKIYNNLLQCEYSLYSASALCGISSYTYVYVASLLQ